MARYGAAAQAGFTAVETTFPANTSVEELVAAKESSGVQQVLINAPVGKQLRGLPFSMCAPRGGEGGSSLLYISIVYYMQKRGEGVHVKLRM